MLEGFFVYQNTTERLFFKKNDGFFDVEMTIFGMRKYREMKQYVVGFLIINVQKYLGKSLKIYRRPNRKRGKNIKFPSE